MLLKNKEDDNECHYGFFPRETCRCNMQMSSTFAVNPLCMCTVLSEN